MNKFRIMSVFVILAMIFSFANVSLADASPLAQTGVITVPTDLMPGDEYRLAFVTTGLTGGTSADPAYYNNFVSDDAGLRSELLALGTNWTAIASIGTVNAVDNTATNPAVSVGVPIYTLNGVRIADNYADLWDGSLANPLNVNRDGVAVAFQEPYNGPWTGSFVNGTSCCDFALGAGTRNSVGYAAYTDERWISGPLVYNFTGHALYGLSDILTVQPVLVTITNYDFETDGAFTCCAATPTGWTHVSGGGGYWGVFPTDTFNPSFYPGFPGTQAGPLAVYFRSTSDIRIAQVLGDTLQQNSQYTLTIAVGSRIGIPAGTYFIELLAGGVSLATATGTAPNAGTFSDVSLVYITGAADAQLGQPLEIRIGNYGGGDHAVDFDNVRLAIASTDATAPTASPTQSPAANGLGWNNTDVTVTWNWSDEEGGSGIDNAACTTSSTSTGEGEITLTATCKDLAGNEGSASYTVKVDQTLPVADAGSDQSIHAGYTVNLDGGASSDDNTLPEELSYNWSFFSTPAGNTATLNNADTATPSFTPNVSGEYVVQLIVTDDADNDSEPVFVTLSSLNMAPTADATATPMLPLLGQAVSLDGSASSDPDGDTIYYQWTVTSKPVGSAASLTNATSAIASITPDVSGTYELTLTVSDFLESGAPLTVSFVASTAEDFAQVEIIEVSTSVVALEPAEITTAGNQNAFGNFLTNTMEQIQKSNLDKAIADLEKAIARTDGCAIRGAPDGNGPGMDWVTTCDAQASIYDSLVAALEALQY